MEVSVLWMHEESDIKNLVYLQVVLKETLRLYSGPLSGLRESTEDCIVAGYHVPARTRLLVNAAKIHRDPLSILYLSQIQISNFIHTKTFRNGETSRWIAYGITQAIYIILVLIFSLLSNSAVSYTIACVYTSKETTFKKSISVVTRVWKRLMVSFLLFFFILAIHTVVALVLLVWFAAKMNGPEGDGRYKVLAFLICLCVPYFIGLVFINVFWHLASVISVLEKSCGIKALRKSMKLIKGKIWVSCAIFTILEFIFGGTVATFSILVVYGYIVGTAGKIGVGILCYLLLPIYFHFSLVTQTVVYFVCKSYHHEDMDKFDEHLEISFVPLRRDKDIQSEQVPV